MCVRLSVIFQCQSFSRTKKKTKTAEVLNPLGRMRVRLPVLVHLYLWIWILNGVLIWRAFNIRHQVLCIQQKAIWILMNIFANGNQNKIQYKRQTDDTYFLIPQNSEYNIQNTNEVFRRLLLLQIMFYCLFMRVNGMRWYEFGLRGIANMSTSTLFINKKHSLESNQKVPKTKQNRNWMAFQFYSFGEKVSSMFTFALEYSAF